MASPEKLTITPERGDPIVALFNPEKYSLSKSVQIAEIGIPGLDSPVLQFVRGQNEKITLELFFDTTSKGTVDPVRDVREETSKVYQLLKIHPHTHAPLRCKLSWGTAGQLFSHNLSALSRCIFESVTEEFSLFSPGGVPLRAKLNVTLREYKTVEEQVQEIGKESADHTKIHTVQRGQTLAYIAWLQYGDAASWRPIAQANDLDNPRLLAPGAKLVIPRLTGENT